LVNQLVGVLRVCCLLLPNTAAASITVVATDMQNDTLTEQQASERAAVEALHAAAKCGDVAAVKAQLAAGVDVDATDTSTWSLYGGTALTIAVENMQPEVLRVLLAGAAVNTAACLGDGGRTPLMLAATGQLQYRDGEAADAWFNNEPPITWSIETPEVLSIVQQLLDAGADVGAATSGGWTALHCAANEGLSKVCGMLLAAGAPLESFSRHEQTPLMAAVTGWLQIYKDGLTAPSDDDDADLWIGTELIDTTPQHLAVVQQLLQAGAAVDAADSKEDTALHYAADPTAKNDGQHDETYSADVIAALVAAGADVNRANKDGETPLHIAAQWGNYGAVAALLAAGADANAANSYGSTPLHYTEGDKECSLNPSGDWRSITTALRRAQKAQSSRKRKAQQLVAPRAAAAVTAAASAAAAAAEVRGTCVISNSTL
jgi:cytohesin